MARIADGEIQRLKENVAVQRLVEGAGIELKRAGKDWLGRCPFHDDRETSLVVTPGKNLWHCFGCQIGGGPIDWVMKHRGVSFRHAVELLREGHPSLAASAADGSPAAPLKRTSGRALAAPVSLDADDQRVLDETIGYDHQRLQDVPEARAYLAARGLDHPQVALHFKLGVADRSLGLRLPEKNRAAGAAIRTQLQRIGLLRQSGHEHFNGSLVIPVFSETGQVVEVYGRKLRDDLRPGTPKHLYLPGPHAGAFIRFIQAMLGHAELSTTQIYTQVAIRQLQKVHASTHPGAALRRRTGQEAAQDAQSGVDIPTQPEAPGMSQTSPVDALLAALDAEADAEDGDGQDGGA